MQRMGVVEHDERSKLKFAVGRSDSDLVQDIERPIGRNCALREILDLWRNQCRGDSVDGLFDFLSPRQHAWAANAANSFRRGFSTRFRQNANAIQRNATRLQVPQPTQYRSGL